VTVERFIEGRKVDLLQLAREKLGFARSSGGYTAHSSYRYDGKDQGASEGHSLPSALSRAKPCGHLHIVRRFIVTAFFTVVFVRELALTAHGDQVYATLGSDDFSIGSDAAGGDVRYKGTQSLHIAAHGKFVRYSAHVAYTRTERGNASKAKATYVADVLPTGELASTADDDPNYLTVLNQPFAAQLDTQTLADLTHLRKPLPFEFPSPFTGSSLHGFLQHRSGGAFGKRRSVAVRFEAAGTMRGADGPRARRQDRDARHRLLRFRQRPVARARNDGHDLRDPVQSCRERSRTHRLRPEHACATAALSALGVPQRRSQKPAVSLPRVRGRIARTRSHRS
jgi:hypothetical protein